MTFSAPRGDLATDPPVVFKFFQLLLPLGHLLLSFISQSKFNFFFFEHACTNENVITNVETCDSRGTMCCRSAVDCPRVQKEDVKSVVISIIFRNKTEAELDARWWWLLLQILCLSDHHPPCGPSHGSGAPSNKPQKRVHNQRKSCSR